MINVDIEEHVLHREQKCMLSYEDLIHWCDEEEISASHIALFMRYLTELVVSIQCTTSYGFLCPTSLSKFASFENEDDRSDYIVKAMTCTGCERGRKLVFAPYFEGNHWMLAAINPKDSVVYWCDPAGTREPREFLKDTINMAITKINSMDPEKCQQKELEWKIIKCPTQPFGSVLCGYYVCRYMLEIIRGRYINIIPSFMFKAPKIYSVQQIDEVRDIWATYALQFKAEVFDGNV
ncbi:uncharacterized protein LOC141645919 isoform X1 [Silene latifolia]|uniref:uncharacterized protein LOC141645919 isoform X1 n=1 Tax=Silene latifolia TaxID=37657 RepID=UPI003D7708AB